MIPEWTTPPEDFTVRVNGRVQALKMRHITIVSLLITFTCDVAVAAKRFLAAIAKRACMCVQLFFLIVIEMSMC